MKYLALIAVAAFTLGFTACTPCYTCTYEVQIQSGSGTTSETVSDEVCTADKAEIDDREAEGQACSAGTVDS